MEYRFVHHWNYELGKKEHQTLEAAILLMEEKRDENFLLKLAAFIREHTKAKYVMIGLLSEDYSQIHTCVFLKDEQVLKNITYPLEHTPCDSVVTQRFCYYPFSVYENFPLDTALKKLNIESYLGSIFLSPESEPMGMIALMDVKSIENAAFAEHLILVLSPAIEEELARLKAHV